MKRVAIYVRYGGAAKDNEKNIEYVLKSVVRKNTDWKLVGSFIDDGFSGFDKLRPALNKLIAACKGGNVDIVLVESLKHISRDFMYASEIIYEMKNIGVDFYCQATKQYLTNSPL